MPDYHSMYLKLISAQADAIDGLTKIVNNLIKAHQDAEEILLHSPEPTVTVLPRAPVEGNQTGVSKSKAGVNAK